MLASSASRLIAAAISACATQRSTSWSSRQPMPVMRFEPLIAARPSRASSPGTGMPARSIATRVASRSPR